MVTNPAVIGDAPLVGHAQRELENELLLNVLLAGHTSLTPRQPEHFWADVPREPERFNLNWLRRIFRIKPRDNCRSEIKWVQAFFFAKLGAAVIEELSPPWSEALQEVDAEEYYDRVGHDGKGLRVPHRAYCEACNGDSQHDSPGATETFRLFFETYAPGAAVRKRRSEMYKIRSEILHGNRLMQLDEGRAFGWDPPWWRERELHDDLWGLTRKAMHNWLANPPTEP